MATAAEHLAAFRAIDAILRRSVVANAHALHAHRNTAAGGVSDRQIEHTLDRLALLHGTGTVENLSTSELFETAMANELRLAHEAGDPILHGNRARAQALLDASRRGNRVRARLPAPQLRRAVHVSPFLPDFERSLVARREPYFPWDSGVVVVVREAELAAVRTSGHDVHVLFLDPDELLDLTAGDRAVLEAELMRRLAAARAAPDHVGDSRARHHQRALVAQSTLLRNLRDRLAADHPLAHAALAPILAENRILIENAVRGGPAALAAPIEQPDPLAASIDLERSLQALLERWTAEDDTAGFGARYAAVAGAGTHLTELERHYR